MEIDIDLIIIGIVSLTIIELFRVFILPHILGTLRKKKEFVFGRWRRPFIKIYVGRPATLKGAAEMFTRAAPNEVIYGQCKTCSNYPKFFFGSLGEALENGARLKMLISGLSQENLAFARKLLGYKNVSLKAHAFEFLRYIGIRNKEVITIVTEPASYVGIHIFDRTLATYIQKNFEKVWKNPRLKIIDARSIRKFLK